MIADEPVYRIPPYESMAVLRPLSERLDWSLLFLGIPEAWQTNKGTVGDKPVKVCILDTGCDTSHPDLQGAIGDAKDFTNSRFGAADRVDHGTWCAGMIGARAGNDVGVGGIAPLCQLFIAKVLGDNGSGNDAAIAAGIRWGHLQGCTHYSLSLGGPQMSENLHALFREISQQADRFIFAASGNDGGRVNYPAGWPEVCAVGAVDRQGNLTRFTSRGPELDMLAPGVGMVSTIPGDSYAEMDGTSMACPVVTGVGVLAWGKAQTIGSTTPLHTGDQMIRHMQQTSVAKGQYGLIDPKKFLGEFQPPPVIPPPPITPTIPPVVNPGEIDLQIGPTAIHSPPRLTDLFSVGYE